MRSTLPILLLLSVACSSASQRPASIPQPEMAARLVNPLFFGSGTTAAATIEVLVRNRGSVPIVIRRIEVDSPGMGQYTILKEVLDLRETVNPNETKTVSVSTTALAQTTRRPTEPLTLRAIVEFQALDTYWREVLMTRG